MSIYDICMNSDTIYHIYIYIKSIPTAGFLILHWDFYLHKYFPAFWVFFNCSSSVNLGFHRTTMVSANPKSLKTSHRFWNLYTSTARSPIFCHVFIHLGEWWHFTQKQPKTNERGILHTNFLSNPFHHIWRKTMTKFILYRLCGNLPG